MSVFAESVVTRVVATYRRRMTRHRLLALLPVLATAAALAVTGSGVSATPAPLRGTWVGGYTIGTSTSLVLENGTSAENPLTGVTAPVRGSTTKAGVTTVQLGGGVVLRGRVAGGQFTGTVRRGQRSGRFLLRRVGSGTVPNSALVGAYVRPDGSVVSIQHNGPDRVWVTDYRSGALRIAWRTGPLRISHGQQLNGSYPLSDLTAVAPSGGLVPTVRTATGPAERIAERVVRAEWQNGGVRLVGKLRLPPGNGPFPAVVFMHGSEGGLRDLYDLWTSFWVSRGFAALSYDKRGNGESTGTSVDDSAAESGLTALAGDATAAVAWLRGRPEVDPTRIGLSGGSQAGWTIPLTVARQPAVSFAVIISGPVTSVGKEAVYSRLTGNGERAVSDATARQALAAAPHTGFDPRPVIAGLKIPMLWLWGSVDRSVFAPESKDELDKISAGKDFSSITYPGAQHGLLVTRTGVNREVPASPGFAPTLFTDIDSWLRARSLLR